MHHVVSCASSYDGASADSLGKKILLSGFGFIVRLQVEELKHTLQDTIAESKLVHQAGSAVEVRYRLYLLALNFLD